MVIGLAFFSWDQKMGSILDFKYPESFVISTDLRNKIYMTHAYDQEYKNDELIEVNFKDLIIFSYCDKSKIPSLGYQILVAIIDNQEKDNIYKFKIEFMKFAKKINKLSKDERKAYFFKNVKKFFPKSSARKVLILGRAGTGKSTIKKIVFEGMDPKTLLYNSLEPTRGITPSIYSWLDLKLGIFDTSGQELSFLLEDGNSDQQLAFENVDIVLYVLDHDLWTTHKGLIWKDIFKIKKIINKISSSTDLVIFFHKVDLISNDNRYKNINTIQKEFKEKCSNNIYFTSIYPELIYGLYNAFYEILSSYSEETLLLKEKIDESLKNHSKTMCFITNYNNSIILQSMNPDFKSSLINHCHKLVAQLTQNFDNMSKNGDINHLILSGSDNLTIILHKLDLNQINMRNLVCISESLRPNNLIFLTGKLRQLIIKNTHFKGVNSKNG